MLPVTAHYNLCITGNNMCDLFSAISPECRASSPTAQLPLSQPAQTAPLPAPPYQSAHAGVSQCGAAHPASSAGTLQSPADGRVRLPAT